MFRARACYHRTIAICFGLVVSASLVAAAPQQAPAPAPPVPQFKNLQVLKDVPPAQINPTMHLIAGQLGVGCKYCHIWDQWERDDKPQKQVARAMLTMMNGINRNSFGGKQMVTCYTCHRGSPKPTTLVALPVPPPPHYSLPDPPPPPPPLPEIDQILTKYVAALGGEQAVRKITSRVMTGTREVPLGPAGLDPAPGEFTIYQKAPNLTVTISRTDKAMIAEGFDGTTAWAQNVNGGVTPLPNPDQGRAKRSANMYEALDLKTNYLRMEVTGTDKVGTRDAYVVVGYPEGDTPEKLYFDTQTGLLLRRAVYVDTLVGPSPFQVEFDEYRDVAGVKMPFVIRMNPAGQHLELGTSSTFRVDKIQVGVAIDDSRFVKPQPRARPPGPAARP